MRHGVGVLSLLITVLGFGQQPMYIEELKQPGDAIRILVTFPEATSASSGVATFEWQGHEGECPTTLALSQNIMCSEMEKITPTQYLFSGRVGNNASGWYKLTRIAVQSGGKERQYLLGRDFQQPFGVTISNPKQNESCGGKQK